MFSPPHRSDVFKRTAAFSLTAAALAGIYCGPTFADEQAVSADATLLQRIESLEQLANQQAGEIARQNSELSKLRADQGNGMTDEMRRKEIDALITDVMADSARRDTFLQAGILAGHNGSSFFLNSADGGFSMNVSGLMQFRYIGNFRGDEAGRTSTSPDDNTEGGFEFRRVELAFSGHIVEPAWKYVVVLATEDGANGIEQIIAQDLKISYDIDEKWTVAAGRYFAPLLREELIGPASQPIALSYMNNELSIGRGEGISLLYNGEDVRTHVYLNDGAGSGGGGGVNNPFADTADFAITGRADFRVSGDWNQWGDFTSDGEEAIFLGVASHYETGEPGDSVAANDYTLLAWTVDGSYEANGLHLYAAVAGEHFNNTGSADITNYGFVTQAGYRIADTPYEPYVRGEMMFFDSALAYAEDDVALITVGTNYHINSHVKIAGDLVWALDPIPTDSINAGLLADGTKDNQLVLRLQLQLKF
ncbi:MAG: hypothetical protein AB8C95_14705 [Phycisphaeraceae bacterium]